MKSFAPLFLSSAIGLSMLASNSHATTISNDANSGFEVLAGRAEAAAYIRVLDQSARFEGGRIVTDSRCEVLSAAFGAPEGSMVTMTTLGGYYGNIGQLVFGLERPAPGDELAVLLGADGYMGGGRRLVGFTLGLYHVLPTQSQDEMDAPLLGYALDTSRVTRDVPSPPLTLGEFLKRAKSAKQ